jgi:hypothetical protein
MQPAGDYHYLGHHQPMWSATVYIQRFHLRLAVNSATVHRWLISNALWFACYPLMGLLNANDVILQQLHGEVRPMKYCYISMYSIFQSTY